MLLGYAEVAAGLCSGAAEAHTLCAHRHFFRSRQRQAKDCGQPCAEGRGRCWHVRTVVLSELTQQPQGEQHLVSRGWQQATETGKSCRKQAAQHHSIQMHFLQAAAISRVKEAIFPPHIEVLESSNTVLVRVFIPLPAFLTCTS